MKTVTISIDIDTSRLWWPMFWIDAQASMVITVADVIALHDRLWQMDKMRLGMSAAA